MAKPKSYSYDVFISYRHKLPSMNWVRDILVPRLEADGFSTIIDFRDFRLGAPLISEMNRAVIESRYTLAILTPSYLRSGFTELESIMAEHIGIQEGQRRLIAIMRERCKPRLSIQARLWLDMSNDAEFDENCLQLAIQLRLPLYP
jgi:hypothetical protein